LNPFGRLIDKIPASKMVVFNSLFFAAGALLLSFATNSITLLAAFFLLRLFGQGVFGLTANSWIARAFEKNRGKASALSSLGFPLSEAVFPSIAVFLVFTFGWRGSYQILALSILFLFLPLALILIKKSGFEKSNLPYIEERKQKDDSNSNKKTGFLQSQKDYTLMDCLKDIKFYLLLGASCLPPIVMTILLFHQDIIFNNAGWSLSLAAPVLSFYALTKAINSLGGGFLTDRISPFYIFTLLIIMMGVGPLLTTLGNTSYLFAFLYMGIIGAALGLSTPVSGIIWPGLFGAGNIGSIKGFVSTFRNGLTALGPWGFAIAIDSGYKVNTIILVISLATILLSPLPVLVKKMSER